MRMIRRSISILLVSLFFIGPSYGSDAEATKTAYAWLNLLDKGKTNQCWDEASKLVQLAVSKEKFHKTMAFVRQTFGKVLDRKLINSEERSALTGVPDGQYIVFTFETRLEHKKEAIETLTVSKSKNGKWKVAGYYIK